jgi:oxygen-dependent protoporphyrinogen oxidase
VSPLRIAVIGGGISGLAAAHRLIERSPDAEVTLLEAADRLGGWIGTIEKDGFVIERGADSILAESPGFWSLVDRLHLRDRIVRTRTDRHGAYVLRAGEMTRIPDGWSLLAPTNLGALRFANVLSPAGRLRVGLEVLLSRRPKAAGGESLASFARRRLGWEALERLGQPLASGIYGSDAETLGLDATLPRFSKMEAEHRSIVLGLGAEVARKAAERARGASSEKTASDGASGARYGLFLAFDRGMQVLVDALGAKIGARAQLGVRAVSLQRRGEGYAIETTSVAGAGTLHVDRVIVALPGPRAATLLETLDGELARGFLSVPHASASTVTFGFDRSAIAHPLDAYGLVIPAVERRRVLAMTWASEKWPGRAPEGKVLIRVFVAGPGEGTARASAVPELDVRTDEELTRTALREIHTLLGGSGGRAPEPLFSIVSRFPRAMPRYLVEHEQTKDRVLGQLSRFSGLELAGNALTGVGIPHAIASGERAADAVLLSARSAGIEERARGVA